MIWQFVWGVVATRLSLAVEVAIDRGRDGLDFSAELLLNAVEVESVLERDEVDCQAEVTESPRSADAVKVCLCVLGKVKVDDDVDRLDVDTAGEEIGADEVSGAAVSEFVKDAVSIGLLHLGVNVEAAVAKLGNLLGQQLNTVDAVAKDDALVDFELGKERVEAVHLLALLDKGVELSNAAQR